VQIRQKRQSLGVAIIAAEKIISVLRVPRRRKVRCFQYNEHEHIAANCPLRTKIEKNKNCNVTQTKVESTPKVIRDKSKRIYKIVKINNDEVIALFDTSSNISLMCAGFYISIAALNLIKQSIRFYGIGAIKSIWSLTHSRMTTILLDRTF